MSDQEQNFEDALQQLESIVSRLEDGELTLEESLNLFEDGIRLSRECQKRLDQAGRRIEVLLKDESGNAVLQPLGDDGSSDPSA